MSNLGFRKAMAKAGITVVETAVGDRYVLEAMRAGHFVLGGEQSGHIIMLNHATTGDGMLTALHLLAAAVRQGTTLAGLVRGMTRSPQVLVNVPGWTRSGPPGRRSWPPRSPRRQRSSAPRAGYWCGRAAPSQRCGSWSRRPTTSTPSGSRAAWPPRSARFRRTVGRGPECGPPKPA